MVKNQNTFPSSFICIIIRSLVFKQLIESSADNLSAFQTHGSTLSKRTKKTFPIALHVALHSSGRTLTLKIIF